GDSTPLTGDGTDFGTVTFGGATTTATFTMSNPGDARLNLSNLPIFKPDGTATTVFTVIDGLPATLAPGASDTFTIRLNTTSVGRSEERRVGKEYGCHETPYDLYIKGNIITLATGTPDSTVRSRPFGI